MSATAPNPMRQMLIEQAVPQLNLIVQMFDAGEDAVDPKGKAVRDAAVAFRDALKEWAS
jgi:hypothetical protein